jgi:hypothetical protein
LGLVGNHRFRGHQKAGYGSGILGDIFLVPYRFGHFFELFHHQRISLVDAPFYSHGTPSGSYEL